MTSRCPTCGHVPSPQRRARRPIDGQLDIWALPAVRQWQARLDREARAAAERTFDFGPVDAEIDEGDTVICQRLRISWSTLRRYRTDGITWWQADRIAGILGCHVSELWHDWLDRMPDLDDDELDDVS